MTETTPPAGPATQAWQRLKDFSGAGGDATYLWPRWIVLRAVGLVYLFVFGGIIREGQALVGPRGIAPLAEFFAQLHQAFPNPLQAFLRAPSFFWINHDGGMVTLLSWLGFAAAVALVLNLWPRMTLFACWAIFVSFVSTWRVFSPAQLARRSPIRKLTWLLAGPGIIWQSATRPAKSSAESQARRRYSPGTPSNRNTSPIRLRAGLPAACPPNRNRPLLCRSPFRR